MGPSPPLIEIAIYGSAHAQLIAKTIETALGARTSAAGMLSRIVIGRNAG